MSKVFNGKLVKVYRERRGWTTRDLADKCLVRARGITEIENGRGRSIDNILDIAQTLGVSLEDFTSDRVEGKYNQIMSERRNEDAH